MHTLQIENSVLAYIDLDPFFIQVVHSCDDLLLRCFWQGMNVNCTGLFQTSKTDVGYCCSFNAIKLAEQLSENYKQSRVLMLFITYIIRGLFYSALEEDYEYYYYDYDYGNMTDDSDLLGPYFYEGFDEQGTRKKRSLSEDKEGTSTKYGVLVGKEELSCFVLR